jgi:hypothetical protein
METEQKIEVPKGEQPSERELITPLKTWFYQRLDGSIIGTNNENDAVKLHKQFKQYGVSDGKLFATAVAEARKMVKESGMESARKRLLLGEQQEQEAAKGNYQIPRERKVFEPNGPTGFKPRQ